MGRQAGVGLTPLCQLTADHSVLPTFPKTRVLGLHTRVCLHLSPQVQCHERLPRRPYQRTPLAPRTLPACAPRAQS